MCRGIWTLVASSGENAVQVRLNRALVAIDARPSHQSLYLHTELRIPIGPGLGRIIDREQSAHCAVRKAHVLARFDFSPAGQGRYSLARCDREQCLSAGD